MYKLNARSVANKMINIFVDVLTNDNLHLISITEMWLCNDDIFIMSNVFNFNCNVLRCDRTFRGCGVYLLALILLYLIVFILHFIQMKVVLNI